MKVLIGQFKKLCELDNWNGTVLNVAHGMIPVWMEFMHVLLQRLVRAQLMQLHAGYCSKTRSDRIHALARLKITETILPVNACISYYISAL
jgi:hypothetical protein